MRACRHRWLVALLAVAAVGCSATGDGPRQDPGKHVPRPSVSSPAAEASSPALGHHLPGPNSYTADFTNHTWVDVEGGHILVGWGRDVIWRSTGIYPVASAKDDLYDVLVGAPGIGFVVRQRGPLFVAAGRVPERQVAVGEWPAAWTPSGNLITIGAGTDKGRDWTIALRRPDGSFLRTLAADLRPILYPVGVVRLASLVAILWIGATLARHRTDLNLNERFLPEFWTAAGNLVRTDGATVVTVSNYRALGFDQPPSISLLAGGLVNLFSDDWHVAILHRDGGVFARASAPTDGSVAGFGSQLASPDGRVVVYALARLGGRRTTTIYALHQGDSSGTPIFQGRGVDWVCAFPPMGWRDGRWLLFRRPDGYTVAIDTSGRRSPEPVDARTAHRLFDASASELTPA